MPTEPPDRSPMEEIGKRFAEAGGGLKAAAFAVGLENHRALLTDHRKRVQDGHKAMADAIGAKTTVDEPQDGEDMGGILVTGDNHNHVTHHYPAPPVDVDALKRQIDELRKDLQQPKPPPPNVIPASTPPVVETPWSKWALAAALAGTGVGGYFVNSFLNKPPAPVPTNTSTTTTNTQGFLIDFPDSKKK